MKNTPPKIKRELLAPDQVKSLSKRNTKRWLLCIALEWSLICSAVAVALCFAYQYVIVWVLAFVFIGLRQHALSILAHDGTHYLVTENKRSNDLLTNLFPCYPMIFTVQGYRSSHLEHHWYLETPKDPSKMTVDLFPQDWTFPSSKKHIRKMFIRDLTGLSQASSSGLLKYLWQIDNRTLHLSAIVVMHSLVFTAFLLAGAWFAYFLLWLAPMLTVTVACYRIRAIAEHTGFGDNELRYHPRV